MGGILCLASGAVERTFPPSPQSVSVKANITASDAEFSLDNLTILLNECPSPRSGRGVARPVWLGLARPAKPDATRRAGRPTKRRGEGFVTNPFILTQSSVLFYHHLQEKDVT